MLKASAFEYRFSYSLQVLILGLGCTAPWNYALHVDPTGPNAHLWGMLAVNLARMGVGNIATAFNVLLSVAVACALAGALLRTWGAAYLGANIVPSRRTHTAPAMPETGLLQDGPFRFARNPMYLGTFLHTLALSLLMPGSGAIFAIVGIGMLQTRLIFAEEDLLRVRIGVPYMAYCGMVPRIVPLLRTRIVPTGLKTRWPQAFLGEIYMWGVAGSFALAGWHYNSELLVQCVLVSLGVSLLARAVVPAPPETIAA